MPFAFAWPACCPKSSTLAKVIVAVTLSSLCGFVDVICVARYGAFPATQTGNVIFVGEYLHRLFTPAHLQAPGEEEVAVEAIYYRLAVMLCSVLGAYAYCAIEHIRPHRTASTIGPVLALMVLSADVIPYLHGERGPTFSYPGSEEDGERSTLTQLSDVDTDPASFQMAGKWCVCIVAFAFGALHFMCSPTSDGSRMKAVTFAATGHLHKLTKLFWKCAHCKSFAASERNSAMVSLSVVLGMMFGAVAGALAMHVSDDADQWLFFPVALVVLGAVQLHDDALEPPQGWGEQRQDKEDRQDEGKMSDAAKPLLQAAGGEGPHGSGATVGGRTAPPERESEAGGKAMGGRRSRSPEIDVEQGGRGGMTVDSDSEHGGRMMVPVGYPELRTKTVLKGEPELGAATDYRIMPAGAE